MGMRRTVARRPGLSAALTSNAQATWLNLGRLYPDPRGSPWSSRERTLSASNRRPSAATPGGPCGSSGASPSTVASPKIEADSPRQARVLRQRGQSVVEPLTAVRALPPSSTVERARGGVDWRSSHGRAMALGDGQHASATGAAGVRG